MKIISFISQKGGSGKTTCAMLIADALRRMGHKVLVVDIDPQKSAHKWEQRSMVGFPAYPVPVEAASGLEVREFVEWLKKRSHYDILVIDTPPNMNDTELRTALMVADMAVVPLNSHISFFDSLEELSALVALVNRARGEEVPVYGVLTRVSRRRQSDRVFCDNAADYSPWPVIKPYLKESVAYSDAFNYRTSTYTLPGASLEAKEALDAIATDLDKLLLGKGRVSFRPRSKK